MQTERGLQKVSMPPHPQKRNFCQHLPTVLLRPAKRRAILDSLIPPRTCFASGTCGFQITDAWDPWLVWLRFREQSSRWRHLRNSRFLFAAALGRGIGRALWRSQEPKPSPCNRTTRPSPTKSPAENAKNVPNLDKHHDICSTNILPVGAQRRCLPPQARSAEPSTCGKGGMLPSTTTNQSCSTPSS